MRFSDILKVNRPHLIVSKRYDEWTRDNANPRYSAEALAFGMAQLQAQSTPRDRRGTVSASSLKKCARRQQLSFIGVPEDLPSPKTAAILLNGTFMHLRWQMAGLTEGFFKQCEVKVEENEHSLSGTLDALSYDDSVIELKSCNSNSFARVNTFGPLESHLEQLATYVLVTGADRGAMVYENKDTQEFTELVYAREQLPVDWAVERAETLWEHNADRELFDVLDSFYENKQPCSTCFFKTSCSKVRSWGEAVELAGART